MKEYGLPTNLDDITGLENDLQQLETMMKNNHRISIFGESAVDNTTLAYHYGKFWVNQGNKTIIINSKTDQTIHSTIRDLSATLNLENRNEKKEISLIKEIFQLFNNYNVLFIYENVQFFKTIKEYLPPMENKNFQVLLISQEQYNQQFISYKLESLEKKSLDDRKKHDLIKNYNPEMTYLLHEAIKNKNTKNMKELLETGADINANNNGWTPLHHALEVGDIECIKVLISGGVNVNTANNEGWTPLCDAINRDNIEAVTLLLDKNAKINTNFKCTPLYYAVNKDNIECIQLLLNGGAIVDTYDDNGVTPLHNVVNCGNIEVLKLLLEADANVNATTNIGYTPLHIAVQYGKVDCVRVLLENGANAEAVAKYGESVLHMLEICKHSADVDEEIRNLLTLSIKSKTNSLI